MKSMSGAKSIKEWQSGEKPREKLLANGEKSLSDSELLAIILNTGGRKGINVIEQAREVMENFGGPGGLASAGVGELLSHKGLGSAKVAQLKAAIELGRRSLASEREEVILASPKAVFERYRPKIAAENVELFWIALLDVKKRLKRDKLVYRGTADFSLVIARDIFAFALRESAHSIICVHNHPSGDARPSSSDIEITRQLVLGGELLGIPVLDHVIVTEEGFVSLADEGWLNGSDDNFSP
ncbi:MAG: DNA repair protein RadC [Myxococcota bacterium]